MIKLLPPAIDIRITCCCNLACDFCFGTRSKDELNINLWCKLLHKFKENGVNALVITGGEPTLFEKLDQLLEHSHNLDFKIALSSNGILLENVKYLKYIDALSIPIDGENYSICKEMRGLSYLEYEKIIRNIKQFKRQYPSKILKVGTVVSKKNISGIEKIFNLIYRYADVWKLYQVSKHEHNARIFSDHLEVSDEDFINLYEYLCEKYGKKLRITAYRNIERNGKYLFCEPNGDALIIKDGMEYRIGNFIEDFIGVLKCWNEYVNIEALNNNLIDTYLF